MDELRKKLMINVARDVLGPRDKNERLNVYNAPNATYEIGKLYPNVEPEEEIGDEPVDEHGDLEENLEEKNVQKTTYRRRGQSNIGITSHPNSNDIAIIVEFGIYRFIPLIKSTTEDSIRKMEEDSKIRIEKSSDPLFLENENTIGFEKSGNESYYLRSNIQRRYEINVKNKMEFLIKLNNEILAELFVINLKGRVSVSLTNIHDTFADKVEDNRFAWNQVIIFQPEIKVNCKKGFKTVHEKKYNYYKTFGDIGEAEELEFLYRNRVPYAIGHNVSTKWDTKKDQPKEVSTSFIPSIEIPQIIPTNNRKEIGSTYLLSESETIEIERRLVEFKEEYSYWITEKKNQISNEEKNLQEELMGRCDTLLERLEDGINFLVKNPNAMKAFKLMNRVIYRSNENYSTYREKGEIDPEKLKINYDLKPDHEFIWRKFQLGFILINIASLLDRDHDERKLVDLLWFPTGSGKTEAYTGLLLLLLFFKRFENNQNSRELSCIMRYTLRLLSYQQFERVLRTICCAELLRQGDPQLKESKPFFAGFWVGRNQFPNYRDDVYQIVKKDLGTRDELRQDDDIFLLERCQWCYTKIPLNNWIMENASSKLRIVCSNQNCPFSYYSGLPALLTDEDIYYEHPDVLVATVDKFARITWVSDTYKLFGSFSNRSPIDLIIQDELHLINGPLGSIVGIYETAIEGIGYLNNNEFRPKIIASTATIRNSKYQISQLYGRNSKIFPPSGIDLEDNYFSKEVMDAPSRLYAGLPTGNRSGLYLVARIYARLIVDTSYYYATNTYEKELLDPYWSLVGYFNSLKELGNTLSHCNFELSNQLYYTNDQIEEVRLQTSKNNKFPFYYQDPEELTSKKPSNQITQILSRMEKQIVNNDISQVVRLLLSSNMLSTGIDIKRLGLMVVTGQPKSTAEYIQATGRVGRSFPGIVFTVFNNFRPRDKSHFENFFDFHQTFYSQVEPMTVTPFALMTLKKALHSVYIAMLRHTVKKLNPDSGVRYFDETIQEVSIVEEFIFDRIKRIDKSEIEQAREIIENVKQVWKEIAEFSGFYNQHLLLSAEDYISSAKEEREKVIGFPTLNSMRDVDVEIALKKYNRKRRK